MPSDDTRPRIIDTERHASDTERQLVACIDTDWIADRAWDLLQIPSVTMEEGEVCALFERQLHDLGLKVDVRTVGADGRNNLYARIAGTGDGPTLMLNGHLDTIPLGDAWPPRRTPDQLYGRGATDMKGGMASMLGAAKAILDSGIQLRGDLVLSAVVGHEETIARKDGPLALIDDIKDRRVPADRILIVEGRDALWVMSMGSMVFTITLDSDRGGMHTQYVPFADNPLRHLGELIGAVHAHQQELDATTQHALAGAERIDLGAVHGGDYFNRTPTQCTLTGTRRWCPGRDAAQILEELRSLARPFAEAGQLDLRVEMEHEREPFETPAEDAAVQAVAAAHSLISGDAPDVVGMRIVGDANLYVHGCAVPTFYYGPSNETAHADEEWVDIKRMADAACVYALAAADYCGLKS
ncbi:MAG: M20/M25/M40 family metallo-hydrolase [Gemmatimonadetes bacterium]|jgi:acetylornithine deacetylase/succinyl-diaminopimelate desuccinylase-like protein|nr:M20/M25/M40 family metallo-hydrolase [Gemmatimonadota bacterium]MBT6146616.1 M20/M25/M40 family metallo-hydrolase [Gemmatimonadota bacterium]MBT7862663.1 M20/M25/M40 family metallo-hydrolase [Gemmatimonadota bacterium]